MLPDGRLAVLRTTSRARRTLGAASPEVFARIYLTHHLRCPPSRMHRELFEMLSTMTRERGARLAIAAPRGHAKTTVVSLAYALWSVLYGYEPFVLMLSHTGEQARQLLTDLKRELTGNEGLVTDFPEVCEPLIRGRGNVKVKAHHLVLPNDACLRVLGAGQGLRGMKHRHHRPSLIIGDDLEDQEAAWSEDQRHKTRDWFMNTVLKAGEPGTNVVVVGTILHYDSLLAILTTSQPRRGAPADWARRVYRAVESFSEHPDLWDQWEQIRFGEAEYQGQFGVDASRAFFNDCQDAMLAGTAVLWEERESYEQLMAMRADEGRASFQAEKQNQPLDPDECLFRAADLRYWDGAGGRFEDEAQLLRALGPRSRARFFGACDPSLGRPGGGGITRRSSPWSRMTRTARCT